MKIIRLKLTNFRGVPAAEVSFRPTGVTVVEGPNEIGKSSLAEAIALIRAFPDSSRSKAVTDVKPVGVDAGPEIELEVTSGIYHFVYVKRFLKKPMTTLHVTTPKAEQWSGREAHDRVEAIFDETLDPQLWDALQMNQGQSLQQPTLARIEPLRTALGTARGGTDGGGHDALLARIDDEYARYFTLKTGKPTGEYDVLAGRLTELRETRNQLDAQLLSVDDKIAQFDDNARELQQITSDEQRVAQEAADLEERHDRVVDLREQVQRAVHEVERAVMLRADAQRTCEARAALLDELARRELDQTTYADELEGLTAQVERTGARLDALRDQARLDRLESRRLDAVVRAAEAELAVLRAARELEDVSAREARATTARQQLADAAAYLDAHSLDEEALNQLDEARSVLRIAERAHQLGSARVIVQPLGDGSVRVDGNDIEGAVEHAVTSATEIEVADVVQIRVLPGRDGEELAQDVLAKRSDWERLLAELGVADLKEARAVVAARREHQQLSDRAQDNLGEALGADSFDDLVTRRLSLEQRVKTAGATRSSQMTGPLALDAAERAVDDAKAAFDEADQAARDAWDRVVEDERRHKDQNDTAIKLQQKTEGATEELEHAAEAVAAARGQDRDDALVARLAESEKLVGSAIAAQDDATTRLTAEDPEGLDMLLTNARAKTERFVKDRRELENHQYRIQGQLSDIESQGVTNKRDAAAAALEDAERAYQRMGQRAAAVRLLRATMRRHQAESQQRYVQPFKTAIETLGRVVFGADFAVEVDADLAIESCTRGGATIPFDSLSGGAREQLSVLGRLACARLVNDDDGAPVILDDALGFADPARLERIGAVLNSVGNHAQVIILTCQPDRFRSIGSADVVRLGPDAMSGVTGAA